MQKQAMKRPERDTLIVVRAGDWGVSLQARAGASMHSERETLALNDGLLHCGADTPRRIPTGKAEQISKKRIMMKDIVRGRHKTVSEPAEL